MTWQLWMIASVILILIEISTPGVFFFACLSLGALCGGLVSLLNLNIWWVSWMVFLLVSVISIYFIKPILSKVVKFKQTKSNVDALIGQKALVTHAINPPNLGMVKIEGEVWRAQSTEKIEPNEYVTIISVIGTKLEVKKI